MYCLSRRLRRFQKRVFLFLISTQSKPPSCRAFFDEFVLPDPHTASASKNAYEPLIDLLKHSLARNFALSHACRWSTLQITWRYLPVSAIRSQILTPVPQSKTREKHPDRRGLVRQVSKSASEYKHHRPARVIASVFQTPVPIKLFHPVIVSNS